MMMSIPPLFISRFKPRTRVTLCTPPTKGLLRRYFWAQRSLPFPFCGFIYRKLKTSPKSLFLHRKETGGGGHARVTPSHWQKKKKNTRKGDPPTRSLARFLARAAGSYISLRSCGRTFCVFCVLVFIHQTMLILPPRVYTKDILLCP